MFIEEWRNLTIDHFNHFQVSNYGRVRNILTNHIIAQTDNGRGYLNVKLKARPYSTTKYVHRLVAMMFLPNYSEMLQVNHIDKNKKNNNLDNLEMVTDSENKRWSRNEYIDGHLRAQGKILQIYDKNDKLIVEQLGLWNTCRKYGFDPRAVQRVITGKAKHHKGYKFKYKSVS